jgi:predicted solute-binding protein
LNSLRIGCVKYLNARPLIRGWANEIVLDHPSALCLQLARGDLDVALVSSFEFLRNPIYRIVDDVSISSDGPVYSVVVAHCGAIADIGVIELDPAAETSANLLRCLLAELNLNPTFTGPSAAGLAHNILCRDNLRLGASSARSAAQLFIGDRAIHFRQEHASEFRFWDLGEQWKRLVALPFVYALWLVRPEVTGVKPIADWLRALRDKNLADIDQLIADETDFDPKFCDRYYREHLRFTFGEREKEGLRVFHELCQEHGLLPKREIKFEVV